MSRSKRTTRGATRELVLRVAAENRALTPANADPLQVLPLATAYLESLAVIASELGTDLAIEGIELRKGSVEIVTHVRRLAPAQAAARELARSMMTPDPPAALKRLRSAVARLPEGVRAEVDVGKWHAVLGREVRHEQPLRELLVLRARLIRVGGIRPAVRLRVDDDRDFSLDASEEALRSLGGQLYREIEVEAEVERDDDGNIVEGKVLSFAVLVDDGEPADAWQRWFDENAGDWTADKVEGFVGRDRD